MKNVNPLLFHASGFLGFRARTLSYDSMASSYRSREYRAFPRAFHASW